MQLCWYEFSIIIFIKHDCVLRYKTLQAWLTREGLQQREFIQLSVNNFYL